MADTVAQMFAERAAAREASASAEPAKADAKPADAKAQGEPGQVAKPDAAKADAKPDPAAEAKADAKDGQPDPAASKEAADKDEIGDAELDAMKESRLVRRLRRQLATGKEQAARIAALEAEIAKLAQAPKPGPPAEGKDGKDWLDEFGRPKPDPKDAQDDPVAKLAAEVQSLRHEQAVKDATVSLQSELAEVAKDHPDVPRELLLAAVELDDKADLHQIAEQYAAFLESVAKPAATKDAKTEDPPKAAVRPPGGMGSSGASAPPNKDIYSGARSVADLFDRRRRAAATA